MALSTHDELLLLRKRARRRLVGAIVMVSLSTAVLWNVVDALPEQAMKPEAVDITGLQMASQPAAAPVVASAPVAASQPVTDLLATLPPDEPVQASVPVAPPPAVVANPAPSPAVVPPPEPKQVEPKPPVAKPEPAPVPKPEPKPEPKPAPKPEAKPQPKPETKPLAKPEPKAETKPVAKETKPREEKKAADPMAILEGRETHAEPAKPPKEQRSTEPEAKPADGGKKFNIQLAALSDPQKVDALRDRLAAAGVAARFSKVQTSKGEVTRVRVGPFKSREEADAAMRRLSKAGVTGIVVGAE